MSADNLEGFLVFAQPGQYQLPNGGFFDNAFYVENGDLTITYQVLTDETGGNTSGNMLLGIYNPYNSNVNVQIESFTTNDRDERSKEFDYLTKSHRIISGVQ